MILKLDKILKYSLKKKIGKKKKKEKEEHDRSSAADVDSCEYVGGGGEAYVCASESIARRSGLVHVQQARVRGDARGQGRVQRHHLPCRKD